MIKIFLHYKPRNKYSTMADTENVEMIKLNLDSQDFGNDLDNSFGIQNTQTIASNELNAFLSGDPSKVSKVAEEPKKTIETVTETTTTTTEPEKTDLQLASEESEKGKKALENALFKEDAPEEITKSQPTQTATDDSTDDTYSTLAKDFLRLGVFSPNSDDETEENIGISTPEEFLERSRSEQKKGAVSILENFLSQFGPEYREAFDAIFVDGVAPKEYLDTFSKIESVRDLDLADEGNQKRILRDYYKGLNWDETKIENKIDKLKDYGELEEEAKSYHEVILNREKENAEGLIKRKNAETENKRIVEDQIVQSYQRILQEKLKIKEIDGIPLSDKDAQDILGYMANKPYKLESGELLSEFDKDIMELNRPENHEQKIKLALLLRKKLDLSAVKKTAVSKKTDELFTLSTKNAKKADVTTKTTGSFFS